jgi:hypothetical protein
MRLLAAIPLIAIVLVAYNVVVVGFSASLDYEMMRFGMMSGAQFTLTVGDVLVLAGLFLLFLEILKSVRTGSSTVLDHILSTAVFIAALVEFLLMAPAGTGTFFILMTIALVDVVAGYSVSIGTARRDIAFGDRDY